ncbi:peptidoglycan DD-metalloendopeptidase family protein [Kineosporia rhizophila]|uniref:M23 family metallopeptidase n=1 Tax=Kineosporia TaxID=49184 RepID=UPI001E400155|nr:MULTISPECIES: M23 family metallopeptidase [Kineosporia]MCE0534817.1 peptidoglycan DD-metalloendopeptidase family protein [Kineosporia rhizophila]GLY19254.1 metalloendopeptidase [Kineosporia sp. NBRC 101677]
MKRLTTRRNSRPARFLAAVMVAGAALTAGVTNLAQTAAPAAADEVEDKRDKLAEELRELRKDLEGTSEELVDAAVRLRTAESRLNEANARLKAAEAALAKANARDEQLAGELAVAEAAVEKAQRDLEAGAEEQRRTKERLAGIAREAYVSSGLAGLSIALDAQSPEQFADRVSVAGTALRAQGGVIDRLAVEQAETRAREAKLDAGRRQVAALKRESEQLVEQRAAATTAARQASDEIGDLVEEREQAVAAIAARKAAEQKRVDDLEDEQDELAQILRERAARSASSGGGGGANPPADGGNGLSYPVSAPITSSYGYRYHPILNYRRLHAGTDFGASCGTPLRAAASGTVVRAGWAGGYGNQIVVDHGRIKGSSLATSSNHLSRISVRSGQTVGRGQVIGYTGTTGLSTGCHLHFEVYVNGSTVDPMGWL